MSEAPQKSLERFIDEELKRVPDMKAPNGFSRGVMARIENPSSPWWQMSWLRWPFSAKAISFLFFAGLAAASVHDFVVFISQLTPPPFVLQSVGWLGKTFSSFHPVWSLLRPFQNEWLFWSLVAFCLTTTVAISAGRVLWPLMRQKD